jgi:hypothetical protein
MALSNYQVTSYNKTIVDEETQTAAAAADNDANKFASSVSRELQPWPSNFQKPSDLYKLVVNNSKHPPLMQPKSWNLAVPFREQRYSHTPSESIANNYTPSANELKVKSLPSQNVFKKKSSGKNTKSHALPKK